MNIHIDYNLFTEPMGSVAPKVDIKDEVTNARVDLEQSVALLCPVQSYPVPIYR